MSRAENYNRLREFCLSKGAALFGVADISSLDFKSQAPDSSKEVDSLAASIGDNFNRAISIGARLSSSVLDEIDQFPTKLYFHHYRTLNVFLDQLALSVTNFIQNFGFKALPIPASLIMDWQNQTAHLSHKKVGYLAGLGWIGRNNLLVNRNLGSQFRLVTVLTNIPIETDSPTEEDCGNCRSCMVICPAKAIKDRQEDFDHQGCFSLLKEFQRQKIVDQYICGICLKVCKPR